MTTAAVQHPQSDDTNLRASVDADGGCCWEICGGGVCLQGRDRAELLRRWSVRENRERPDEAKAAV
jgi:hypothetical protein